jgi:hypothetical protein
MSARMGQLPLKVWPIGERVLVRVSAKRGAKLSGGGSSRRSLSEDEKDLGITY